MAEDKSINRNPDTVTKEGAYYDDGSSGQQTRFKDVKDVTITLTDGTTHNYKLHSADNEIEIKQWYDAGTDNAYTYEPLGQSAVIAYCALALTVGLVIGYLARQRRAV